MTTDVHQCDIRQSDIRQSNIRQAMAGLHTWSGLLLGWLLYVIFVCGTVSYWQVEITRWMQPEVTRSADPVTAIDGAMRYLQRVAPDATTWYITPPSARSATTSVFWQAARKTPGAATEATLDGGGDPVRARDTKGGYFLYRFHYDLYAMPVVYARYIVGVAAMFMLVTMLSGIVVHKKIFADFFLLRFGKGQRSWLDAHNVSSVLALPFHLMITYTGLVTLATMYMPWAIAANYATQDTFYAAAFPQAAVERTGRPAALTPFAPIRRQVGGGVISSVQVGNPGDAAARVVVTRSSAANMDAQGETLVFDGVSGVPIGKPAAKGVAVLTESVMIGLHTGRYAGALLRWLYFLSGLTGVAMVATGLILWTVKRRKRVLDPSKPSFGFRVVERLNVAVVAGFPAAVAVYFLANRLLPLAMTDRAEWEIRWLFISWGAAFVFAGFRQVRRGWIELLGATGVLFLMVQIVDVLTNTRWLVPSIVSGDWVFAGFDLTMLATSALFGFAAWKFGKRVPHLAPRRGRRVLAVVA
jgi:uncharacterized iron-regulated membrane protein